jgi:hypothetical protein
MPITTDAMTTSIRVKPFRLSAKWCSTKESVHPREIFPSQILISARDTTVKTI